uniref:DAN domain family member 5, BMP antagonist n=1 Tax=Jaculus jaculus TaxID=51337 RepID=A0A8C5KC86_JACJA
MIRSQLTMLLGLLSGVCLPTASGRPRAPAPPTQSWTASNQTRLLDPLVLAGALGTWTAFLGLQSRPQGAGRLQHGQEVAAGMSLPLDPQEVTQEKCKAVPFVQVFSRPGCTTARVHNHLCFGLCSSFYVPGPDPSPFVLCKGCVPTRQRRAPVALWCGPASPRRVRMSALLVEACQCHPKL